MKTVYYTFTTWNSRAMAAGFDSGLGEDRGSALIRQTAGRPCTQDENKVVDLSAWRTAGQNQPPEEPEDLPWEDGEPVWEAELVEEEPLPAPRSRRSERAMLTAELVSTLCVAAVAAALILRVLTF